MREGFFRTARHFLTSGNTQHHLWYPEEAPGASLDEQGCPTAGLSLQPVVRTAGNTVLHAIPNDKDLLQPAVQKASARRRLVLGSWAASALLLAGCASRPTRRPPPPPIPDRAAREVTMQAMAQVGKPYRWGGSSPREGFDCSGLVQHVYREALGIELPRTSREMGRKGRWISYRNLAPGDLVFFQTGRHPNTHVGVYIGNHRFVHAPSSGSLVRVESMNKKYWMTRFNGGRRPG